MELLKAVAAVLADTKQSPALQAIMAANPVRISEDPYNPAQVIRVDDRAGTREHGQLDANGNFIPLAQENEGLLP